MWIKLDNSEIWVRSITKLKVYSGKTIGSLSCTMSPGAVVPIDQYIMIGSVVSLSAGTTPYFTTLYEDPVDIDDEYTLLKIIDRIDTETTLEKLED